MFCSSAGPQNGWNDPPALSRAPKKKVSLLTGLCICILAVHCTDFNPKCIIIQQVAENYTPPAPITAPIMAQLGADPQAGATQSMVQGQHGAQVPYSGMVQQQQQQQLSPTLMNPAMPKTSVEGAPGAPTGDVIQVHRYQVSQNIQHENVRFTRVSVFYIKK